MLVSILTNVMVFTNKWYILYIFVYTNVKYYKIFVYYICLLYIYDEIYNEKQLQSVIWTLTNVSKHINKY